MIVSPGFSSAIITAPLACAPECGWTLAKAAAEQLLGALDGQRLDRVGRGAALIVAAARIAFRIFVGEHRALRFEHRAADDILRRDQLDLRLLAVKLGVDASATAGSASRKLAGEEAVGLDVVQIGGGGHQARFLFRGVGELIDAPLVAAAEEVAGEESGDAGLRHVGADQAGAEGDGIGVIVLAGERCRKRLGDLGAAAGRIAVDGDGDADARPANGDSALGPTVGESLGEHGAVFADNRRFRGHWCRGR